MVEPKDTLWKMNEHTKAKHDILQGYLKAWFPILSSSRFSDKLVYVDGFAGPGKYEGGEDGSPIIALKTILSHTLQNRLKSIKCLFIEERKDRLDHLSKMISELELPKNIEVSLKHGKFAEVMEKYYAESEKDGSNRNPTFAFIDPFGYTETGGPKLLGRILKYPSCEVLLTYMVGFIDKSAYSSGHFETICEELGFSGEEIKTIINLPEMEDREKLWITTLKSKLIEESQQNLYHLCFCVKGYKNRTLYYLVYFTKHKKGLEVMKEAMFNVGKTGTYVFSDHTCNQSSLVDYSKELWIADAAKEVYRNFAGETVRVLRVKDWVIINSLYKWRKEILRLLEKEGHIEFLGSRKMRFTYPDGGMITFLEK